MLRAHPTLLFVTMRGRESQMLDCKLQKTGDVFASRFQCPPAISGRLCDSPTVSSRNVNDFRRPLHGRIFGSFNVTHLCLIYYWVCVGPSPPHADTAPRRHRHRSAPGAVAQCRHPPRPVRLASSVSATGAVSGRESGRARICLKAAGRLVLMSYHTSTSTTCICPTHSARWST
jgi:hypothetical protein